MRRLRWLSGFPCQRYTLLELVLKFGVLSPACREKPPELAGDHPAYAEYSRLVARDRAVFVRRLLSAALEAFAAGLKQ